METWYVFASCWKGAPRLDQVDNAFLTCHLCTWLTALTLYHQYMYPYCDPLVKSAEYLLLANSTAQTGPPIAIESINPQYWPHHLVARSFHPLMLLFVLIHSPSFVSIALYRSIIRSILRALRDFENLLEQSRRCHVIVVMCRTTRVPFFVRRSAQIETATLPLSTTTIARSPSTLSVHPSPALSYRFIPSQSRTYYHPLESDISRSIIGEFVPSAPFHTP